MDENGDETRNYLPSRYCNPTLTAGARPKLEIGDHIFAALVAAYAVGPASLLLQRYLCAADDNQLRTRQKEGTSDQSTTPLHQQPYESRRLQLKLQLCYKAAIPSETKETMHT